MVRHVLRAEGLAVFFASLYLYSIINGNWFFFILLLFAPDISMAGYLKNSKIGSITYNLMHNYILAIALIITGSLLSNSLISSLGAILAAHVGMDRVLGF